MGHDVTIITTDFGCDSELLRSAENAKVTVLSFSHLIEKGPFAFSPSMEARLKGYGGRFDIFHMYNFKSYQNNIVHDYAVRNHIPYVPQAHGSVLPFFDRILLKKARDLVWGPMTDSIARKRILRRSRTAEEPSKGKSRQR
jgi:hypothetical protein